MHRNRYVQTRRPPRSHGHSPRASCRGIVLIVLVVLVLVVELIVVSIVIGGARDHSLTVWRMQTVESFYASEAGINMAIREFVVAADEDGDTKIGGISDDGNAANDPTLGNAQLFVTAVTVGSETTLTSEGRSGETTRTSQAIVSDS